MRILAWLALFSALTAPAHADLYSWTDAKGTTHYSSKPPPKEAKKKRLKIHKNLPVSLFEFKPSTAAESIAAAPQAAAPPASAAAPGVELYSTSWCGYCSQARAFLRENRIAFKEYDVEHDRAANERFKKLGGKGVPFAVIGGTSISGYSPQRYGQMLGIR